MERYYAIEIIGYGRKQRFSVKEVVRNGKYGPVTAYPVWPAFLTEESARAAAADAGIEIKKIGDAYQII